MHEAQLEKHRGRLGSLYIGLSILNLTWSVVLGFLGIYWGFSASGPSRTNATEELIALGIWMALLTFLMVGPGILTGIAFLKRWRWTKPLALLVALFQLPSLPLGSVLGLYTLWFFMQPGAAARFSARRQ